ncbi:diguanylate cyclase domain-containing protein [Ancylobacter sp. SL191]|uniref:diguanylate cyclase domain-containing protein n=1 Tax=Ancylobacter sp. SL191 TaxID=2995166 RepID=UPI00226FD300|nr:diguanylate cyclase [Ancylobacter sp. SL191]WAC26928.1 diguanylate cyclase [Ancylobacter sp. SL191]
MNPPVPVSSASDTPSLAAGSPDLAALCRIARDLLDVPFACLWQGDHVWLASIDDSTFGPSVAAALRTDLPPDDPASPLLVLGDTRNGPAPAKLSGVAGEKRVRFLAVLTVAVPAACNLEPCRLAVLDTRPRDLAPDQRRQLLDLGTLAGQALQLSWQAELARRQEKEFRLLAETSTDTIVRGNLEGIRLYISPSVRALLGYEPEELIGHRAIDLVHPEDRESFGALMAEIRSGKLETGASEVRQRHKDGHWVWMEASVRLTYDPATGAPNGYVASVRDIQRRKQAESHLEYLASHDTLTGLANRAVFDQRLAEAVRQAQRDGRRFALFCMDIDGFKRINDTFGHQAGDAVLSEAARRFQVAISDDDIAVRLGGDEFALIRMLDDAEPAVSATMMAERLIDAMARPILFRAHEIQATLSIGIALAPQDGLDVDQVLSAADRALYAAKLGGRNTYRFASR